ncbi:RHS repeat-associated core domain-containing protein [Rahnella sp. PCH160]|uniref:RHS repeat-associated core domain-containing protein n=1 Tax=Rahnella sp. PCH160 TaxID=3447928 RepID=UPI0039FD9631
MADEHAARLGDAIIHTSVMADIAAVAIQGIAVAAAGAIVMGVAIVAAPVLAVGGIAATAVAAAGTCLGSGLIAGFVLEATGMMDEVISESEGLANMMFPPSPAGVITTGATDVLTNDIPAARAAGRLLSTTEQAGLPPEPEGERDYVAMLLNGIKAIGMELMSPTVALPPGPVAPSNQDIVLCEKHPPAPPQYLAEGSSTVSINDLPAVRGNDRTTCGGTVSTSTSPNVTIGGAAVIVRPISSGKVPGLDLLVATSMLLMGKPSKMFSKLPCMLMMMGAGMLSSKLAASVQSAFMPVHAATGAKVLAGEEDLDFVLPARFPLRWQRIYSSRNTAAGMFGTGWRTSFESRITLEGEMTCFHDESGRELRFASLAAGERKIYPDSGLLVAAGDEGQILVADLDGSVWRLYLPDPQSAGNLRLTSLCDEYGNGLLLHYDVQGKLAEIKDTENSLSVSLHYQIASHPQRVTQITDTSRDNPRTLMTYDYGLTGQLAKVTDAADVVLREFDYTAEGLMAWHVLPSGLRSEYRWQLFDDDWRVISHVTSAGRRSTISYDMTQRITRVEESDGMTREHHWNAEYLVERFIDEAGNAWCYAWDENQQLTQTVAPDGATQQFFYDASGNLVKEIDPAGGISHTIWLEQQSNPRQFINPQDGVYSLQYDACHGVIAEEDELRHISRYERDEFGQVTAYINPLDGISRFLWNERGQLTQAQDCSGHTTLYTYDEHYRQVSVTDATGESRHYEYDAAGRILRVTSAEERTEHAIWDEKGQLVGLKAADGTLREYGYDRVTGQLSFSRDALGGTVSRTYDPRGRLIRLMNENGEAYGFNWGENDRLTEERGLDGVVTRYGYDVCDRSSNRTFAAGTDQALTHHFTRNLLGQIVTRQTPDGITQYQYDLLGQLTDALFAPKDGGEPERLLLAYDPAGQLLSERGRNGDVNYRYDALGNRSAVTLPDGRSLKTLYYGSGHALQVMLDSQLITEFSRDALHRETGRTQGVLQTGLRYDRHGRISERWTGRTPHSALAQSKESWHYDLRDNLTLVHQSTTHFRARRYTYDAADHLTGREGPAPSPQYYRYDPASNPLDTTINVGLWPHNRVMQHNECDYRYDIYGRTTEKTTHGERWKYRYNSDHQLIEVLHQPFSHTRPECVVNFSYDPLGRRISKRVRYQRMDLVTYEPEKYDPTETQFLWEGPRLLAEFSGSRTQVYAYSDQNSYAPLARIDGTGVDSKIYYFHNQVNGQPEAMTDNEGNECWRGEPDSWGKIKGETHPREIKTGGPQNLRMQGQYLDRETGLHYNLYRYYDPDNGRFTQQDTIGLLGGLNLYQYAPNALGWVDPLGLTSCFYRGSKLGEKPSFVPKPNEFKIDSVTGNVKTTHGVSVFDNPTSVSSKGFEPHKIDMSTVSDKLNIIQRGNDLKHFEIVPSQQIPFADYVAELAKIKVH